MDSTNFNGILQKTLNTIDEIKDQLSSENYLEISDDLSSLHKLLDNKFYQIRYVTQTFTRSGMNSYTANSTVKKEIIKLTGEEYTELQKKLNETDGFVSCSCNMVLAGIKDRLSKPLHSELVGTFQANCLDDEDSLADIFDKSFELTLHPSIAIISCEKL